MAANDDLDDFFKKKDRKGNKHKKQPTLLTNNEELLKQLVIVTSATSAFKENMDFDEDDDEEMNVNNHHHRNESNNIEDGHAIITKNQTHSTSNNNNTTKTKLSVQDNNNNNFTEQQQQQPGDEWEEFEDSKSKYEQLRLKFARPNNDDDENDDNFYDDENNHQTNFDENLNNLDGGEDGESRTNRRRDQQKDKPAWKLDQVKQTPVNDLPIENVEESAVAPASKPTTTGAYRPPQLRGNSSVTVVSGVNQRISKKEKPNLASTEEFPTLGAAIHKK